jgi:threonine/homoserine/homoserine lactone efflux protein
LLAFLAKGLAIGFAIAAPVGPIGVLVIRRTFAEGRIAGFVTGLGAASADAAYGAVAGFGLTAISAFLLDYQAPLKLFGGLFLCVLGVRTFLAKPSSVAPRVQARGLWQAWVTTAFLTLTNPATILSFLALFAGAGLGQRSSGMTEALALVMGVFTGSAAWWLLLSAFIARWRARYPELAQWAPHPVGGAVVTGVSLGVAAQKLRRVNRISGAVLALFGLAALASLRGAF